MYKYETHLHTSPVSKCARADVRETLECYLEMGYDGVFVTNHFLDGNINIERDRPYEEKIEFYFSDYEEAARLGPELGIKVFLGVEISYAGTDFLIYGLDKAWYLEHPEIMEMKPKDKLAYYMEAGAFVIQAHPFREDRHIDHVRLFPRSVHGIETINANRRPHENMLADVYADAYGFYKVAGTDNHAGKSQKKFAGVMTDIPINSVEDYIEQIKNGTLELFAFEKE